MNQANSAKSSFGFWLEKAERCDASETKAVLFNKALSGVSAACALAPSDATKETTDQNEAI